MLASALHTHSQLRVAGEILVRPECFGLPRPAAGERRPAFERRLLRAAWQSFDGCIIHRRHVRALRFIARRPHIRVLFLRRRNWLAQFASERLALRTGVWHIADPHRDYLSNDGVTQRATPALTLRLSPEECRRYRDAALARERLALDLLQRNLLHNVTYEELSADWEGALAGVLDFLGVRREPLQPATQRQEERPLSAVVENLAELRELQSIAGA
jgi:LPS sulfotransferase NodH